MPSNQRRPFAPSARSASPAAGAPRAALAFAGLLTALAAPGCAADDGEAGERALAGDAAVPLARADGWAVTAYERAPLDASGAPAVACGEQDARPAGEALELSTGACNFALLGQPSLADVYPGDQIVARVWWGPRDAAAPAPARLRIFLGLQELWQETVEAPGPAGTREARIKSLVALPAGTPVLVEVQDRGANTWSVGEVTIVGRR